MDLSCVVAKLISVFSGYNDASIIIYSPKKIIKSYYRCDKRFHLDEILDMEGWDRTSLEMPVGFRTRVEKSTES